MEPGELESLLEIEDSSAEAWCVVFRRLIINIDKINYPEIAEIVYHALLKKVEDIWCKDKYSAWKIAYIVSAWNFWRELDIPDNFQLSLSELPAGNRTDPLYSFQVNFNRDNFMVYRHHLFALYGSDVKGMHFLLNYGYLYPIDVSDVGYNMKNAMNYTTCCVCKGAPELPGHVCTAECETKLRNRRFELRERGYENLRVYQRGFKRIALAALCFRVLRNRITNYAEQHVQCVRLYFRAIADPFVQADEFGELLRFFLSDVSKDSVDEMIQDFKRLYPESQGPFRPRSLKHLCRFVIRQKLSNRSEVLPVLLDGLGLPTFLKMYIMGDL